MFVEKPLSHPLSGANVMTLMRVMRRAGLPGRKHLSRYALACLSSLVMSPAGFLEKAYIGMRRGSFDRHEAPIFIVGHWRSGTTHLYNVLSQASQFHTVSPFATALPWNFLLLGRLLKPLLKKALPKDRYIDSIPVTENAPQEDEIGMANMTPLSFYHALYFPKHFERLFQQGLYFDAVAPFEVGEWRRLMRYYMLKLAIEAGQGKTLLIKNPAYTARIGLLRAMWPKARFIHVYRNPYKVFFSMRNFYEKLFDQFALQEMGEVDIDDHIFTTYDRMMECFEKDTKDMKQDQLVNIRFDDFQANPVNEIKRIYDNFGLAGFERDTESLSRYLDSVKKYRKNIYDFDKADLDMVSKRWRTHIDRWGYAPPESD